MSDRQIDRLTDARRQYTRVVRTFVDHTGLSSAGEIEIAFEPAFQNVVLHGVRLVRNGRSYDRLDRSRVHTVESDSAQESEIYDGSRALIVLVPDLRVGDTLEYEYTTVGANPVFEGRVLEEFPLQWDIPLAHLRMRVVAPRDAQVSYRTHGTTLDPTISQSASGREWLWEARDVSARLPDVGIEAHIALVSTRERDRLGRRLASPLALDHAVVRIDYGDERGVVWVDPTLLYQRGPDAVLASRVGGGLLLSSDARAVRSKR